MIEHTILSHLIHNETFGRKVLPFLKEEYFADQSDKVIFKAVSEYVNKYNSFPSREALVIDIDKIPGISGDVHDQSIKSIENFEPDVTTDPEWLLDRTEKFCQDRAIYNAIMESVMIIDGKSKDRQKGAIPQLLTEALGISFDTSIGHDFILDSDNRYDFYHKKEARIPFDLEYLNNITKGGIPRKTLNIILAGTGVGKTLAMCHFAAANLSEGKNVLYITMEMAEERIAERIDANLMNVTVDELQIMPRDTYKKKIDRLKEKTKGRLIIKEYPTSSAGSANFRHLLHELKVKRNFVPDIIYIDYLNICASSRVKMSGSINSYLYIKAIAEELRGLAVEFNVPIVSATQTNRDGFNSSDVDLTNTSESFGLPATADFMFAIISTEELEKLGQLMFKQLKNRYGDLSTYKNFVVGVDRAKMKLYDVEKSAQVSFNHDTGPVMDDTEFGGGLKRESKKDFSKLRIS